MKITFRQTKVSLSDRKKRITRTVTALELRTFLPRMLVPERLCSLS